MIKQCEPEFSNYCIQLLKLIRKYLQQTVHAQAAEKYNNIVLYRLTSTRQLIAVSFRYTFAVIIFLTKTLFRIKM